jgi:Holliday junction resolvase RusA-like endonuclease
MIILLCWCKSNGAGNARVPPLIFLVVCANILYIEGCGGIMAGTENWEQQFQNNEIIINLSTEPVSLQNKTDDKNTFRNKIHAITKYSPYIITNTCFIDINYYCQYDKRYKNHGAYDIDNIVKPILDSLNGNDGIIIDDCLFDRVDINWIDKNGDDELNIRLYSLELLYIKKDKLIIYKNNNWCLPFQNVNSNDIDIINKYFETWNKIQNNTDYYEYIRLLPIQRFIPYNKLKDKSYKFIDINI